MRQLGTEQILRELADDGRRWVATGRVTAVAEHRSWGWLLTVEEQPTGRVVQARPCFPAGNVFPAVRVDDEVLLVYPGGRTAGALALAGLSSGRNPVPSSADNAHLDIVEPGGVQVRTSEAATVEPVLRATTFQADLDGFLAALQTFLTTCSTATFAAQIAGAAGVLLADARLIALKAGAAAESYSAEALDTE